MVRESEYIEWADSHSPAANVWIDKDHIDHEILIIQTVGYVIHETSDTVTVASSLATGNSEQVSGVMTIPKVSIVDRKTIKM